MFNVFPEQCMTLGSGLRFLQDAADRICTPSSFVLVHPVTVSIDPVIELLAGELDSRGRQFNEIDVGDIESKKLPKSFCAAISIDLSDEDTRSFDRIQDRLANVDVIFLLGFQAVDRADKKRWIKFISRWSENVKQRIDQGVHATILVVPIYLEPAMIDSLRVDTTLHVAWWWGIPSLLELQLVCRGNGIAREETIQSQWQEHLAAALASGDMEFLQEIWPHLTGSISDLVRLMKDYAEQRDWTTDSINQSLRGYSWRSLPHMWCEGDGQLSLEPPRSARRAWADGLLSYSPEYGCELHAAAASQLDENLARTRIWRAQLSLLSPQLDFARSMMCQELTNKLGKDWPVRYDKPKDDRERKEVTDDPLCCQLGYLNHLLQNRGDYQRVNSAFRILSERASALRNDLSHLRPIDFSRYQAFHDAASKAVVETEI